MVDSQINLSNLKSNNAKSNKNLTDTSAIFSSIVGSSDLLEKASEFQILNFVKIIGRHRGTADEIKELKNGYFASFGTDNRLVIYDKNFNLKLQGEDVGDWIYHILEITSQEKIERDIQIIVCTNKCLYLNSISLEKNTSRIQRYDCGGVICLELKKNNYVICSDEGVDHFSDLFSKIIQSKKNRLFEKPFRGGLVLNQNLVAFTSNDILTNGEDCIKFYNPNSKKITKEIAKEYSFIVSANGLTLLESKNKELNRIFLAACKKYYDYQKNGILLVISSFEETDSLNEKFLPTNNYEPYCFCPLSLIKNENITKGKILDNNEKDNVETIKTNYFLVGGFDGETRRGLIKLYRANFEKTDIEYIQDIEIENVIKNSEYKDKKDDEENKTSEEKSENSSGKKVDLRDDKQAEKLNEYKKRIFRERNTFKGFAGPISSIIQSSLTGNILVTCYDGYVYLLTPPNLDYYLRTDKEGKERPN